MFERLARREEKEKAANKEEVEKDVFQQAAEEAERAEQERPGDDVEMHPEEGVPCWPRTPTPTTPCAP